MNSESNVTLSVPLILSLSISKQRINKTVIRFGFCDILNNQGLGKCYQPRPSALLIILTSTLIIPDVTKPHPIIVYLLYFVTLAVGFI